jgi:hypothetical protein
LPTPGHRMPSRPINPLPNAPTSRRNYHFPHRLEHVIERLPVTRPCDLDALLPAHWAAANRPAAPPPRRPVTKSERRQAA